MNDNKPNRSKDVSQELTPPENLPGEEDFYEEDYDLYEEEDLPYPPGEAYQAYRENPTYENAIEAAEEIWGIPDPRLIED